jgi:aminopeptidase N
MSPPFHIPLAVKIGRHEEVLSVKEKEQTFRFEGIEERPVPSLLRGFSAPVILRYPYSDDDLIYLLARDDDPFNRWEAAQRLAAETILKKDGKPSHAFMEGLRQILRHPDPAFVAEVLALPSETFLAEQMDVVDPDRLHASRNALRRAMALALSDELSRIHAAPAARGAYAPDPVSAGWRALRNLALGYLAENPMFDLERAFEQFRSADNMTDCAAALGVLANAESPLRERALEIFYRKWKDEPLVVDKWLAVQAGSRLPQTLARVRELLVHPAFDLKVPNKVYSLIRAFAANHVRFHAASGEGYAFLADQVLALDRLNPQVAARIARGFDRWTRFDSGRKTMARAQLERIRDTDGLSKDVAEIVTKALA